MNRFLSYATCLLWPRVCPVCGCTLLAQEEYLCIKCMAELPLTNFWNINDNTAEQALAGRFRFNRICSLLFYREEGAARRLIHRFKYKSQLQYGLYLASMLGRKMALSGNYNNIDYIVAVPMHIFKKWKRGYNQSYIIAKEIERELNLANSHGHKAIVTSAVLKRVGMASSQTALSRLKRWESVSSLYAVKKSCRLDLNNCHILLVDDVITTGATIEACATAIVESWPQARISVTSLGYVN